MSSRRTEQAHLLRLRKRMRERGVEGLLVTQRENVRWLTGFTGSAGSVVVGRGRPVLVTDFRYQVQAMKEAPGAALVVLGKDPFAALREAAQRAHADVLWFDEASLTVERVRSLRKAGFRLKGGKDLVGELRQRKDPHEVALVRTAIHRAEEAFRELRKHLRPGITERQAGLRLEWLMRERGARRAAFDIIVASGRNGAMPHASVSERMLRNGDLVTIDFGAEADGYYCDITRTLCVGRPTARQREVHGIVRRAQESAIRAAVPGMPCREVDRAARDIITAAGHGSHFGHATGHGIGLMVHEGPSVSAQSKAVLEQGMIVTVEPGIYVPGWGGVRIEDMVLVTDRGPELLTSLPRDLER